MPIILKTALEQQIERWQKYGSPLPNSYEKTNQCVCYNGETITSSVNGSNPQNGDPSPTLSTRCNRMYCVEKLDTVCYDARGNGDGKICPTVTGDHNNRITDYTTVLCQRYAANSSENGIAGTINMHYYLGCGARNGNEREFVVFSIDRASFNQVQNAKYDMGIDEEGKAFTVTARGPGAACYCLQGNGIDREDTTGCNGCGWRENECYTLNTIDRHAVCYEENKIYIVRRLTPLECGRLQGMPDFWCRDVPHSDANEYKMWGNGMALPNALYVMEGFMK